MKCKVLLLTLFITLHSQVYAQTKSTGVVNLLSGMTAKLDLDNNTNTATLTFTGPADRWYALQFGNFNTGAGMSSGQDVVYYNGATLVDAVHNGIGTTPSVDTNNWTLQSNNTNFGIRTLVATRPFNTGDPNDFTFNFNDTDIDFAFARGSSASFTLAYHGFTNRGYKINNSYTTLGSDDVDNLSLSISLVPNPASTYFKINNNTNHKIKQVTIFNALGQEVSTINLNLDQKINISHLRSGKYYVEIKNDLNQFIIKQVIIN